MGKATQAAALQELRKRIETLEEHKAPRKHAHPALFVGLTVLLIALIGVVGFGNRAGHEVAAAGIEIEGGWDMTLTGDIVGFSNTLKLDAEDDGAEDLTMGETGTNGGYICGSSATVGGGECIAFTPNVSTIVRAEGTPSSVVGVVSRAGMTFDLTDDATDDLLLVEDGTDGFQFTMDPDGANRLILQANSSTGADLAWGGSDYVRVTLNGGQFFSGGAQQGGFDDGGVFVGIGASPNATCTPGTVFIDTDETDDTNCTTTSDNSLCLCVADDTWVELDNN